MSSKNMLGEIDREYWDDQTVVSLATSKPIWKHFYTVSPLIVIGTKEGHKYDLAPKHMAMAMGQENYFGFVCTPEHATYHNVKKQKEFTVSFPKPSQITLASLAATPRCEENNRSKNIVEFLPTIPGKWVDALFIKDAYLYLECALDRIIDGFGKYSLISGKIIRAYVDETYLKTSDSDQQKMMAQAPLLAFLAYSRFAVIEDSYVFPMPKDFTHLDE
jgi:flavin reductase (DIM6/NTAB) family NADH-FMN oxidoreductase RutF